MSKPIFAATVVAPPAISPAFGLTVKPTTHATVRPAMMLKQPLMRPSKLKDIGPISLLVYSGFEREKLVLILIYVPQSVYFTIFFHKKLQNFLC
jgi:hypothetical protein